MRDECGRNFGHRKHQVHGTGLDGTPRHAAIGGLVGVLGDHQPALLLDGLQPKAAVGAGSRQDDADGACAVFLRQ